MILFKSFEWKPHSGSERHEFKSSFCLLKLRSITYSLSGGESYHLAAAYSRWEPSPLLLFCSRTEQETVQERPRPEINSSEVEAAPALRLVTLAYKRQKEQM